MGIRDTTYYGWKNFDGLSNVSNPSHLSSSFRGVTIYSGTVYSVGQSKLSSLGQIYTQAFVRNSSNKLDYYLSSSTDSSPTLADLFDVKISNGVIFVCGRVLSEKYVVLSSSDGVNFSFVDKPALAPEPPTCYGAVALEASGAYVISVGGNSGPGGVGSIARVSSTRGVSGSWSDLSLDASNRALNDVCISQQDGQHMYIVGVNGGTNAQHKYVNGVGNSANVWFTLRSSNRGSSWTVVDTFSSGGATPLACTTDKSGVVYVAGISSVSSTGLVKKSTNGTTWTTVLSQSNSQFYDVKTDSKNNVYVLGRENNVTVMKFSPNAGSTWFTYDMLTGSTKFFSLDIDEKTDQIVFGGIQFNQNAIIRSGLRAANSMSLGPSSLATSFGYVVSELSGVTYENFKLNNISEFPHSSGLFQMRNMILGTTTKGKIGTSEDSIINVRHIGSTVRVMWPRQADQSIPVKGYGDFSIGNRSGKLVTTFIAGDAYDATEFDHLALYCYLTKESSGTLDSVEIVVERKPLKSAGFAKDQAITYEASGSYTVGTLTDLVFKKQIDYGDSSLREIGFPIDVPLVNVKEVRVQARHINGQSEENKNFIIWGRFIKSNKETNET